MNFYAQRARTSVTQYLAEFPFVNDNYRLADYKQYKSWMMGRGIDEEDIPTFTTFWRWIKSIFNVEGASPGRVKRETARREALTKNSRRLLQELFEGSVNYEDVEFWFDKHRPCGLTIDGRFVLEDEDRIFPPKPSTVDNAIIKGFAAGLLYAMNKEAINAERRDQSNTPEPDEVRPVVDPGVRDAAPAPKRRGKAQRVASKVSARKRQPNP